MDSSPFAVLSLIVAPAILTNASSVMIMSTSNRLARLIDRARELSKQLEQANEYSSVESQRRLRELMIVEERSMLVLRSLRSFYVALGAFALAALVSLLGAILLPTGLQLVIRPFELGGVLAGLVAVGALINGSALLLRETRRAVQILTERAANVQARALAEPNSLIRQP